MAIFRCKACGGDLEVAEGSSVGTCEFCGRQQTLPTVSDEALQTLFNRANVLRMKSEFDKAADIYEKILQKSETEAEAYWGLILCKYGIEYVEDPATYNRVPTCHRASYDAVTADEDYRRALQYADLTQRPVYEAEAAAIDEIQRGIIALAQKEDPYDVFICYKETDAEGKRTQDSVIANDVYYQLTHEGFKVFYAAITLEDKLGSEYEPYIFSALNTAKVMLVMGTKPEYFNAVWVKNEWSRFLKIMKKDRSKMLIPCYRDMDPYELPEEFAHLQAQDMAKIGFINDLVRGIKKVAQKDEKSAVQKETVVVQSSSGTSAVAQVKRGNMALEDGEWSKANDFFEEALNLDPECAEAYLGKLMMELKVKTRNGLRDCAEPFDTLNNYRKVLRFGDEKLVNELKGYITHITERNENKRLTGIYNKAVNIMKAANSEKAFIAAVDVFQTISGFKDADSLAEQCVENAERLRLEAEKRRKEQERNAELARLARAEKAKKLGKGALIVLAAAIVCAAVVLLVTRVVIPNRHYNEAVALMDAKQYEEAIAAFEAVEGYKDSEEQIEDCNYAVAVELMESGEYKKAIASFKALDGYKDSEEQIETCKTAIKDADYAAAVELMEDGDYEEAFAAFDALKGYKDSETMIAEIKPYYYEALLSKAEVGSTVFFGAYEQDNDTSNGKEDIEWRVLAKEDNRILVISERALDRQSYNTIRDEVTWETCSLRTWLNGTFLNSAFSELEQTMIQRTTVSADKNPVYSSNPGDDTTDKVFLLSITEAEEYFTTNEDRKCVPTEYAIAQGVYKSISGNTKGGAATCWWWLRSPGCGQEYAASVSSDGSVRPDGEILYYSEDYIRPAMWINLDS